MDKFKSIMSFFIESFLEHIKNKVLKIRSTNSSKLDTSINQRWLFYDLLWMLPLNNIPGLKAAVVEVLIDDVKAWTYTLLITDIIQQG